MVTMRTSIIALLLAAAPTLGAAQTPAVPDCKPQTQIDVATIKPQIIMIGELHGNDQTPAFVGGLVCSLLKGGRSVILAVERDGGEQAALDRYLDSEGGPANREVLLQQGAWAEPVFQDGRSSAAMLMLIEETRRLRRAGHRVGLLAMQSSFSVKVPLSKAEQQPLSESESLLHSRLNDRGMADKLAGVATLHRGYTIVALAGNVHTSTQKQSQREPQWQSMGQLLQAMEPIFVIGLASAEGGSSWNCRSHGCLASAVAAGKHYREGT